MLLELPDHETLYRALQARDTSYDGRVFVCVKSTGIFCRLSCPARDPLPQNCHFTETVAECLQMGYRACKRCHPLGGGEPMVEQLLRELDARPQFIWSEAELQARGYDPSTVRRAFKRQYGVTFLEMARLGRIRSGFENLADGGRVVDAQCEAGFESASALRSTNSSKCSAF